MSSLSTNPTVVKVFSDASLQYGAWINHMGQQKKFAIPKAFQYSSYASEFYAARQAIWDSALLGKHIHLYCDNLGVCGVLDNWTTIHPIRHSLVQQHLTELSRFVHNRKIHLKVSHLSSQINPADPISHVSDSEVDGKLANTMLRQDCILRLLQSD